MKRYIASILSLFTFISSCENSENIVDTDKTNEETTIYDGNQHADHLIDIYWYNGGTRYFVSHQAIGEIVSFPADKISLPTYYGTGSMKNAKEFVGWNIDEEQAKKGIIMNKDVIVEQSTIKMYAVYQYKKFSVSFYNGDNKIQEIHDIIYGTYLPLDTFYYNLNKVGDKYYSYTFAGWSEQRKPNDIGDSFLEQIRVTKDINLYAVFYKITNKVKIVFKNCGVIIHEQFVPYFEDIIYNGTKPTRKDDENYTYSFIGWSKNRLENDVGEISTSVYKADDEDITLHAVYSKTSRK